AVLDAHRLPEPWAELLGEREEDVFGDVAAAAYLPGRGRSLRRRDVEGREPEGARHRGRENGGRVPGGELDSALAQHGVLALSQRLRRAAKEQHGEDVGLRERRIGAEDECGLLELAAEMHA